MNQMFRISKPANVGWLKMLIYGSYGSGKTTLAASAQDVEGMANTLFIDSEAGTLSIAYRDDIDVVRVTNYSQFSKVYEFLRHHSHWRDAGDDEKLLQLQQKIDPSATEPRIYRTVIIDSLTEVQKQVMNHVLGLDAAKPSLDLIPESPELREWGQAAEMVRSLIRSFRDLPMHVLFVCAEQEVEHEKRLMRRPNLPGKLAGEVQGFLDVVGYLNVGTVEGKPVRRLFLQSGNTHQAKHRFGNSGVPYLEHPTMQDLYNLQQRQKGLR